MSRSEVPMPYWLLAVALVIFGVTMYLYEVRLESLERAYHTLNKECVRPTVVVPSKPWEKT